MTTLRTNIAAAFLVVLFAGGSGQPRSTAADLATNLPAAADASALSPAITNADPAGATGTNMSARSEAEEALRLFLALQEARHAQRLAAEPDTSRDAAAVHALEEKLATRLESIERGLAAQRDRDAALWQESHRKLLAIAVACAALCLMTILAASFFQWRTLSRLTSAGATTLVPGLPALSGAGPMPLEAGAPSRWLEIIDRLERRVRELEQGITAPALVGVRTGASSLRAAEAEEPRAALMGRGQTLLQSGQAREALQCFEKVLAEDARHVEALLKRGLALERLNRMDEAMESYERAAELAPEQPRPWLCQAGVLNQQERFAEALACYERALRVREHGAGKPA